MSNQDPALAEALRAPLARALGERLGAGVGKAEEAPRVENLRRLTAGAANETWRFDAIGCDAVGSEQRLDCVLRRSPRDPEADAEAQESAPEDATNLDKLGEAGVQSAARAAGVPAAEVLFTLDEADGLGEGYVMAALDGETLPRRILRDEIYADLRPRLAGLCGETLARLHGVDPAALPALNASPAATQLERYGELYRSFDQAVPVFDLALRWLEDRCPEPEHSTIVHGDFRNGNIMVGPEGIRAVMDWELAHIGDPMEDLGWICVTSWRFGVIDAPVGGFGTREDLFAGYEAAGGGAVDPERVHFWELLGTLKWGVMCMMMTRAHLAGVTRSVERAAIGRRVSETELDLLELLAPRSSRVSGK